MNIKDIFIRGIDFRTPEREAVDGMCREVENLYPSGPRERPIWRPASQAAGFYSHAGGLINGFHIWHRSNQQSALVYLYWSSDADPDGGAPSAIYYVFLDSAGNIAGTATLLWAFPLLSRGSKTGIDIERTASFAQIGDNLAIAVTEVGGEPEIYIVTHHENVPYCFPFNIPFRANGYELSTQSSTLPDLAADKSSISGYYGIRTALELYDGTYVRPTGVVLGGELTSYNNAIKITMTKIDMPSDGIEWRKLVRGVAFFLSDMQGSSEAVLRDSIFRYVGTMAKIFDEDETLVIDMYADDLPTKTPMHEDLLTVHDVIAAGVFSYNKNLLLTDVRYKLLPPEPPMNVRVQGVDAGASTAYPPTSLQFSLRDPANVALPYVPAVLVGDGVNNYSWSFQTLLTWVNPLVALTVLPVKKIEVQFKWRYFWYAPNSMGLPGIEAAPNWIVLKNDDNFKAETFTTPVLTLSTKPPYDAQMGDLYLDYRVRAHFTDGKASDWTTKSEQFAVIPFP